MTAGGESPNSLGRQTGRSVDLRHGTVQILDIDGRPAGAGFVVGERLLVTCAHVLDSYRGDGDPPADPVTVRFIHRSDDGAQPARVAPQLWRRPEAEDVAFLRFDDALPTGAQVLPLGASPGIRGHQVRTYGFAGNMPSPGAYGFGVAGDQIRGDANVPLLQLTECNAVTEGFSGGPVLDERTGLVVGMVSSVSALDRLGRGGDAFATPTEVLREICPELAVSHICPYWGLEPFTFADAEWFYGRDRAVDTVLASLGRGRRFLALLGPSGSGKSSLIHAGVLPALARGRIPGSRRWDWVSVRPGAAPFVQLERDGLPGAEEGLVAAAERWFAEHPERERLVLVFDQCEELLTTTPEQQRQDLFDQLITVTEEQSVTVVMVLRNDFYVRMAAAAPGLMELMQQALVNIPAQLDADELHAMIERPADLAGLTLEPDLVERIIGDATLEAPGVSSGSADITVLPLLEFTLTELWRLREDGRLTHGAYKQIGGVVGGLARWCDDAYHSLPATLRPHARRIITSLVKLGDENANIPPTRRRRPLTDLPSGGAGSSPDGDRDVDQVVAALASGRRLLITSRDPISDQPVVELVHDILIHKWGRLIEWLARDHDFLTWLQDLESDYEQWKTSTGKRAERDPERLLRGGALGEALRWRRLREPDLAGKFTEFIRLSARRRRIRVNLLVGGAVIVSLVLINFTIFSVVKAREVADERNLALSRQLAANAQDQLAIDPERSLLLAQEARKIRDTPEAQAALRQATLDSQARALLRGHQDTVFGVAFSADGRRVVSAGEDGTVRIWDASGAGVPVVLRGHRGAVFGVAFSADGRRVVSAGEDGTVRIWDASGAGVPVVLGSGVVLGVAFSPDGKRVVSAGDDGTVRVWDASGAGVPVVLRGHTGRVYGVAFSPDGQRVVSASADGTVRIWGASDTGASVVLPGNQGVYSVAFSPDGQRIVSAGKDATVRIWNVSGVGNPLELSGHDDAVLGVAFSGDGQRVVSASADGTVRVWNTAGAGDPVVLTGHQGKVYGVAFSPDGKRVVSAGKDAVVRVWDVSGAGDPVVLVAHQGTAYGVAFSPDGKRVVSAGKDAVVRVWDASGTGAPVELTGHQGRVLGVAFSPDGQRVVSAGDDGIVRVWDVSGAGGAPVMLSGHQGAVRGVAFSADGRRVVSAGEDGTVRVWDVSGAGSELVALKGHQGQVLGVAFSADGRRVASAGADGTVRVWDVSGAGGDPVVLRGHQGTVYGVAFSADGRRVASAGSDTTVRVWDASGTEGSVVLAGGHHGTVYRVAFSGDGKWIASAGADTTVRIWDASGTGNPIVLHDRRAVRDVALSRDGKRVASVNVDGMVRLWTCEVCRQFDEVLKLAEKRSTRTLTCVEREIFLHEPPCR